MMILRGSGFVKHVYENLEMVIAKAKEKVNGNCGCTEETSCYGCLRNYGNQFFHDVLSRRSGLSLFGLVIKCG